MPLKARSDIHLARRLWHFLGVMFILALYLKVPPERSVVTALSLAALIVAIDWARLYFSRFNRTLSWLFQAVMRESERDRMAGVSYMLIGVAVIVVLFPRFPVILSLLFLGVADPLASYFGIRYGRDKLIGQKSVQGTLAAFITCFILSFGFFYYMNLMRERLFIVCLISGLIGAASELIPIGKWDDNLVFPVLSATLLTGLFYIFGGL